MRQPKYSVRQLLEDGLPWPAELSPDDVYQRLQDDHDGDRKGTLLVGFLENGDVWISIPDVPASIPLRFRTALGGGNSVRLRNALVLVALAMKLDQEDELARAEKKRLNLERRTQGSSKK